MTSFEEFIKGCEFILSKDKVAQTCAEHDEIYIACNVELFSEDDIEFLDNLGFSLNEGDGFRYYT